MPTSPSCHCACHDAATAPSPSPPVRVVNVYAPSAEFPTTTVIVNTPAHDELALLRQIVHDLSTRLTQVEHELVSVRTQLAVKQETVDVETPLELPLPESSSSSPSHDEESDGSEWEVGHQVISDTTNKTAVRMTQASRRQRRRGSGRGVQCSVGDCELLARSRGLCRAHGGEHRPRCSERDCESFARDKGLCRRHGGSKKCSEPGCPNADYRGGRCQRHVPQCSVEGCTLSPRQGGVCLRHAREQASLSLSSHDESDDESDESAREIEVQGDQMSATTNNAAATKEGEPGQTMPGLKSRGRRGNRPRVRAKCSVHGCELRVRKRGLCRAHGGGEQHRQRCSEPECTVIAQVRGLCRRHGGRRTCNEPDCTNVAIRGGRCKRHGQDLTCSVEGCTFMARHGGKCFRHADEQDAQVSRHLRGSDPDDG